MSPAFSAASSAWMVRAAIAAFAVAVLLAPSSARGQAPRPEVRGADAAVLIDARSGDVLVERAPNRRRAIASATKLMTAMLAIERTRPSQVFAAPAYHALPAESKIGLRRGERMAVRDLLEALLLESANDAAATIATGVSGSRRRFVSDMNGRARELGLTDTSFANPVGLDDPGNYSSARDLANLARLLMRTRAFARIVDLPAARLQTGARPRKVDNRNALVRNHPFVDGIKTGHTRRAGYVLVDSATGAAGGQVISVVLGEPSETARNADTLALLRWGVRQFTRERPLRAGRPVARVGVRYRDDERALVPRRDVAVTIRRGETLDTRVEAPNELTGPLPAGARVGSVAVVRDGEVFRRVDLVTASAVPGAGPLRILLAALGVPLTLLIALGIVFVTTLLVIRRVSPRRARGPTSTKVTP